MQTRLPSLASPSRPLCCSATPPTPPPLSAPREPRAAKLASLRFLVGDWNCYDARSGLREPLAQSSIRERPGGWFHAVTRVRGGNRDGRFHSCMSFDAYRNEFVEMNMLDNGDYGRSYAPGWDKNALAFEGRRDRQAEGPVQYKKTYVKLDDDTFAVKAEVRQDGAEYICENQGICRRAAPPPNEGRS